MSPSAWRLFHTQSFYIKQFNSFWKLRDDKRDVFALNIDFSSLNLIILTCQFFMGYQKEESFYSLTSPCHLLLWRINFNIWKLGCQELASLGMDGALLLPIYRGCHSMVSCLIFWVFWHENEREKDQKKSKSNIRKEGEKIERKGEENWKACDACPKIRLLKCWTSNLFLCGVKLWERIPGVVLVEVIKVYKWWCILFLRRIDGSALRKKVTHHIELEGPWSILCGSPLEGFCFGSCGDLKITSSWFSWWYMTSSLLLLCMFLWFDCNHQGVPKILNFDGCV